MVYTKCKSTIHECIMTDKLRENKLLSDRAKYIFGDIVDKCYISTTQFEHLSDSVIEAYLDEVECHIHVKNNNDSNDIDYDEETIYILFVSGRLVRFSNSEWADIALESNEYLLNS